jgi:hypothetical protein
LEAAGWTVNLKKVEENNKKKRWLVVAVSFERLNF